MDSENQEIKQAVKLYDADAEQEFRFRLTDADGEFEVKHRYAPVKDDLIRQYDEKRVVTVSGKGDSQSVETDNARAVVFLFNQICSAVEGYGEEGEAVPANWLDLISLDEKMLGINELLACDTVEAESSLESAGKIKTRRAWGTSAAGKTVRLRVYFSGAEVVTTHVLGEKTAADVAEYNRLRSNVGLKKGKRINRSDVRVPAQMADKAAIYDRMNVKAEGYAGRVPLHHKAAVITDYFETDADLIEKK